MALECSSIWDILLLWVKLSLTAFDYQWGSIFSSSGLHDLLWSNLPGPLESELNESFCLSHQSSFYLSFGLLPCCAISSFWSAALAAISLNLEYLNPFLAPAFCFRILIMSVLVDACSLAFDPYASTLTFDLHASTLALEDASDAYALANIHALAFSMSFQEVNTVVNISTAQRLRLIEVNAAKKLQLLITDMPGSTNYCLAALTIAWRSTIDVQ
ncbi:hypothetical protein Tco_1292244 [Tanacetum coccineum]